MLSRRNNRLWCWLLMVILGLGGISTRAAVPVTVAAAYERIGYFSLPFQAVYRSPLIFGSVNQTPVYLLVDTGFTFTTVDRSVASGLDRLTSGDTRFANPWFGGLPGTNWAAIRRLMLDRAEYFNIPTQVRDLRQGHHQELGAAQGILGTDFLWRNGGIILCGEDRILFKLRRVDEGELARFDDWLRRAGYDEIALDSALGCGWTVPVQIGDEKLKLLVDTGAVATVLSEKLASRIQLRKRWGRGVRLTGVEGRETKAQRMVAESFQVAGFPAGRTQVLLGSIDAWTVRGEVRSGQSGIALGMPFDGMLGMDFFQKHQAIIDCQHQKMWLRGVRK
jgi:predicted aspartyl protease